jgi:hypothetical protein
MVLTHGTTCEDDDAIEVVTMMCGIAEAREDDTVGVRRKCGAAAMLYGV